MLKKIFLSGTVPLIKLLGDSRTWEQRAIGSIFNKET